MKETLNNEISKPQRKESSSTATKKHKPKITPTAKQDPVISPTPVEPEPIVTKEKSPLGTSNSKVQSVVQAPPTQVPKPPVTHSKANKPSQSSKGISTKTEAEGNNSTEPKQVTVEENPSVRGNSSSHTKQSNANTQNLPRNKTNLTDTKITEVKAVGGCTQETKTKETKKTPRVDKEDKTK